ncbi:type II secretion system F family protein [Nocardioides sp. KR10-350]|uniref:type II secretion system F family protein n=1 Tax=Nocardioides cheoyonin TaxID=3156615 RepID=UPI0032B568F3
MTGWWAAAAAAGLAAALLVPVRPRLAAVSPGDAGDGPGRSADGRGWMLRWRGLWCLLAAAGALAFIGGPVGLLAAPAAAAACWVAIGRAEPPAVRAAREEARRDLPHLVRLLGAALAAGSSPGEALALVAAALPGAAADRLAPVAARLRLGADPVATWQVLADDPALAPLGRTLARAHATGTPVAASVARLADDLARTARGEVEDRARAVGVKAAVPLGLCLLPAFLLVGVVPLVGGLLSQLRL